MTLFNIVAEKKRNLEKGGGGIGSNTMARNSRPLKKGERKEVTIHSEIVEGLSF